MDTIKASELPRRAAEVLQAVRTGGTVVITHYGKPIAQITPYEGDEQADTPSRDRNPA
jgi:prevent-host-death family protein